MKEPLTILIVEDSEMDAKRIETLLRYSEHADCTLQRATSLGAALNILRVSVPDVVVIDLGLPDASGTAAITAITSRYAELPIVVLTGHGDFASGVHSIKSGAQEYISKSDLTTDTLERAIVHARERFRVTRKHTKLYRNSLINIAPDAATVLALQHKVNILTDALDHVRASVAGPQPSLLPAIDTALASVKDVVPTGVPVQEKAREVVTRMSMVPDGLSGQTEVDPRSILSSVLERYASSATGR